MKTTETQKKTCAVYGEGAMNDQTCQKRFAKFPARDFLTEDAPQLGRPVEVGSNQIMTLIKNNQCYMTRDIADLLKISKSMQLLVKMKNMSFILWKNHTDFLADPKL